MCTVVQNDSLPYHSPLRPLPPCHAVLPLINNNCKGKTPFLFACSTGVVDIVYFLAKLRGFNTWHLDDKGRGAVQLARGAQGDRERCATWLLANCKDDQGNSLPETKVSGRRMNEKRRGQFQPNYRSKYQCNIERGKYQGSNGSSSGASDEKAGPTWKTMRLRGC